MPVLHAYVEKQGVYIRSQIDGNPITFQVSPAGEQVLTNMGYRDGSDIPWDALLPLYERGDIYTNKTGVNKTEIHNRTDGNLSNLSPDQREHLQAYLSSADVSRKTVTNLKAATKDLLDLSMTALAERELNDLILSEHLLTSIQDFNETTFDVESIQTPTKDKIGYRIKTDDKQVRCVDARWSDNTIYDFQAEVENPDGYREAVHVNDGYLTALFIDREPEIGSGPTDECHQTIYEESSILETIRTLFLYVPYYDVRPDPRNPGHCELCTPSELVGKHIWVTPEKYASSASDSEVKLVTSEYKPIKIRTNTWEPLLIEVPESGWASVVETR